MNASDREARLFPGRTRPGEHRSEAQRDVDRLMHSSALRRLGDITQVEHSDSARHTRLTHSLEVAQVGRRITQRLLAGHPELHGALCPDTVAAACLAHDLGHPPFGHVGEEELDRLCLDHGGSGFEGNAQSLRVITRLAVRSAHSPGLNLTRATLGATLKYPWTRAELAGSAQHKYGAYPEDQDAFDFALGGQWPGAPKPSARGLEAALMDRADDLTYAVHDLADYTRAGRLPLHLLSRPGGVQSFIDEEVRAGRGERLGLPHPADPAWWDARAALERSGIHLVEQVLAPLDEAARSPQGVWTINERAAALTADFSRALHLDDAAQPSLPEALEHQLGFLKALIWQFVIDDHRTGVLQHGARRTLRALFTTYHSAARRGHERRIIPPAHLADYDACAGLHGAHAEAQQARLACDIVASLGEQEARELHQRLSGLHS